MIVSTIMEATGVVPSYCGTWNASANCPNLMSGIGEIGNWYKISYDGKTNLDGITLWKTGDVVFFDGNEWCGLTYKMVVKQLEKHYIKEENNG